ncbi:MAG: hypothetical protein NTW49_12610 [Bacteroidia bacterium]|nr:hypothetical protein [Bacteroidia bacterium]
MKETDYIPEKISSAGKKSPFTVPDGYFERLPKDLAGMVNSTITDHPEKKSVRIFWPLLAVAAGLIIAVVFSFYRDELLPGIFGNNQPSVESTCISQLSTFNIDEEDLIIALGTDSVQPIESEIIAEYIVLDNNDLENMIVEL